MIGVVLWSDPREGKAVIWCEDHGELAFFRRGEEPDAANPCLDAGDLISFDVETKRHLRFAHNPEVIEGQRYAELPGALKEAAETGGRQDMVRRTAEIIPLFQNAACCASRQQKLAAVPG